MFVSHSAHSDQGPSSGPGSPPYRDFPDMFQLVHSEAHTESKQLVGILLECFHFISNANRGNGYMGK